VYHRAIAESLIPPLQIQFPASSGEGWRGKWDKSTNTANHWEIKIILDDLYPASREKTFAAESKRLRSSGLGLAAIAKELGLSKGSVWRMLKTPDK
jgi:hypothetical protein